MDYLEMINTYRGANWSMAEEPTISYKNMGSIIYYYAYAQYTSNAVYEELANELLDTVYAEVSQETPVCLKDGLCGLAVGLIYLMRNKIVEGNEDEVLRGIENRLIYEIVNWKDDSNTDWYGWLYYMRLRLIKMIKEDDMLSRLTLEHHLIHLLDRIELFVFSNNEMNEKVIDELKLFHHLSICPTKTNTILSICSSDCAQRKDLITLSSIVEKELTIVIPVRIDSVERENNLDMLLAYLTKLEGATVLITEGDSVSRYKLKCPYNNVHYSFVEDADPVFYRTKYINRLIHKACTSIVGIWDTDVYVSEKQIRSAVDAIRSGKAAMSFPYDGHFYMLSSAISNLFKQNPHSYCRENCVDEIWEPYWAHSVGGAFLINKEVYLQVGGENEYFYGWGPEDVERVKRMGILGLPIFRSEGSLFHMYHPRKKNSWFANKEIELRNRKEYQNIYSKNRQELYEYIQSWEWLTDKN